jgi:hypothetical protein
VERVVDATRWQELQVAAVELFACDGKIVEIWNGREARGLWS